MSTDQQQADVPTSEFKMEQNADKQCRLQFYDRSRACKQSVSYFIDYSMKMKGKYLLIYSFVHNLIKLPLV